MVETSKLEDSLYDMLGASHKKGKQSFYIEGVTVDIKIKKKIWLGEYIDLGLLASRSEQKPKVNVQPSFWAGESSPDGALYRDQRSLLLK